LDVGNLSCLVLLIVEIPFLPRLVVTYLAKYGLILLQVKEATIDLHYILCESWFRNEDITD
jgi:hypothetical protein